VSDRCTVGRKGHSPDSLAMAMRLSLVLIFALALCAAKRHGGCRGEGSHPYGKHGRGEGKGKGKGGGRDDGKWKGEEGKGMGNNERHEHHDRHEDHEHHTPKREFYLNTTLVEFQDKWDEQGVQGPSTADAAVLLSECLAATDSEELKSMQCATEYQWMEECIDCDLDKWSPGLVGVVSAGAGVGGVFVLCAAIYCYLRVKRSRILMPTVGEFEPHTKPDAPRPV